MKNLCYALFSLLLVASYSCKKEDCAPGELSTNIVGEWTVTSLGFVAGDVEFNANGSLVDQEDVLIGGEIGGVILNEKSYMVESNTRFSVRAANGTNFIESDVEVLRYTCDEMTIEVAGFEATMKRK